MMTNKFGEMIFDSDDFCDLLMQGRDILAMKNITVDPTLPLENLVRQVEDPSGLMRWAFPAEEKQSVSEFDVISQNQWFMPDSYKRLDIAEYVLSLCQTQEQLQRVGQELLLFQEHHLFDLLRYLKYLVDVMTENQVIWGVGRGSSVASYVLFLLGVHKIDSIYYDLDPREFLR